MYVYVVQHIIRDKATYVYTIESSYVSEFVTDIKKEIAK